MYPYVVIYSEGCTAIEFSELFDLKLKYSKIILQNSFKPVQPRQIMCAFIIGVQ